MVVAGAVEEADTPTAPGETETEAQRENRELWRIKGESVLELGAGKWPLAVDAIHPLQPLTQTKLTHSYYLQAPPSHPSFVP